MLIQFFSPTKFLLGLLLLWATGLAAQIQSIDVSFETDALNAPPQLSPGSGQFPSTLVGDVANTLKVENLSGAIGSSTAMGKVLMAEVASAGDFRLVDFNGLLNSGIVSKGTVRVAFDFIAYEGSNQEGFAFLRCYDDTEESFADIGFSFLGNGYTIGLLDYDPLTGDYLGWREPSFPDNFFELGTWHRLEAVVNLDNNTMRLVIDGSDYGLEVGISRATGEGYAGAFFNWGTAFAGRCGIDNFSVSVPEVNNLPQPPAGFAALQQPNTHGGTLLRLPCGDFRARGLDWENYPAASVVYDSIYAGVSVYRARINDLDEADARLFSFKSLPVQANRSYEASMLVRTDFPRETWEFSLGAHGADSNGEISLGARYGGLPAITQGPDGWERWTWRFTPHWDERYPLVNIFLGFHEYGPGYDDNVQIEIADLAFVELPAEPLTPFAPVEGVTFPGGAGDLPMAIESVEEDSDKIEVTVTGAVFTFSKLEQTLEVAQRIDMQRTLTRLDQLPLTGLTIQSQTDQEVVLVGDDLTIGVQLDGMVVLSPHQEWSTTVESVIGGDFNRLTQGDLLCQDDFGGFTVNVHTPKGTGLMPRMNALTPGLDFPNLVADDLASTGAADAGWKASVQISPGERLFVSAFPSRPYDWERSFEYNWGLTDYNASLDYDDPEYMSTWIIWNISQRGWAMSFGERYETREDVPYQDHMDAITAEGDNWSAYFSQWFYYSRDAEEWANEVKRWRDTYGMGAVYSDGLAQDDWLSAYESMRRLRADVFPAGDIIIHDSYPQSGVPAASFRPFIYSYATSTYMGENAAANAGADWAWARYTMGQFRRANCFGVTKGDSWNGFTGVEKYLVALVWGGRGRPDVVGYESTYLPILNQLRNLWLTYGDDPYFFDRYYHPEAQLLTTYEIGRAGMPIFQFDTLATNTFEVSMSSWTPGATLYYTLDGTLPNSSSLEYTAPILWDGMMPIRVVSLRGDLDPSRVAELGEGTAPLGVDFLNNLQVRLHQTGVLLDWATAAEWQNDRFVVQRSADGQHFQTIGTVAGKGESDRFQSYQFYDAEPLTGQNYYRLQQWDVADNFSYSPVATIRYEVSLRIFPNPSNGHLSVEQNRALYDRVEVFTGRGDYWGSYSLESSSTVDLSGLPAGIYFLEGRGKRGERSQKIKLVLSP